MLIAGALCLGSAHARDDAGSENNGTDPTRVTRSAAASYKYDDFFGGSSRHTIQLDLTLPFGDAKDYSVRLRTPIVGNDVAGNSAFSLGDASVMVGHVFGLTPKRGYVAQGELVFDSASRAELGSGRNVFKATLIHARFLPSGIFAPAIVHSFDLGGDSNRAKTSATTLDFYYVPRFANPRVFMTLDPALNFDWEGNRIYPSVATTLGRSIGHIGSGTAQLYIKPTLLIGGERPSQWSIEAGFKVIGF